MAEEEMRVAGKQKVPESTWDQFSDLAADSSLITLQPRL